LDAFAARIEVPGRNVAVDAGIVVATLEAPLEALTAGQSGKNEGQNEFAVHYND
jgi:hypothetical protein